MAAESDLVMLQRCLASLSLTRARHNMGFKSNSVQDAIHDSTSVSILVVDVQISLVRGFHHVMVAAQTTANTVTR